MNLKPNNMDSSVIQKSLNLYPLLTNNSANRYLRFGFIIRALQIKDSRFQLNSLLEKDGTEKRNPYLTSESNIYINSFYINLIGGLDNLAWVLHYELNLVDGASEKSRKRQQISLFHKEFIKRLRKVDEKMANDILTYKPWFEEIKEFRDPAAHRIPLYCPPGVITDEHQDELEMARTEFENQDYSRNPDEYMNALHKVHSVGEFKAMFIGFSESGDKIYPLQRTINADYDPFWELSDTIITNMAEKLNKNIS